MYTFSSETEAATEVGTLVAGAEAEEALAVVAVVAVFPTAATGGRDDPLLATAASTFALN
jgi:hypothetical protein